MSILDFFSNKEETENYSKLYEKLKLEYADLNEDTLIITSCYAGLLASVAYVDLELDPSEVIAIEKAIKNWGVPASVNLESLVEMSLKHIDEMSGLENHLYTYPLNKVLTKNERFSIIRSLFSVAASDGSVDGVEVEEIRTISKAFGLSNQHFLSARAEVLEYLRALK